MAVDIYRSDDTSAPVWDGTQGSYIDVLKAVLIDGYGAKAGAGWTLEYDEIATNGVMIIRSNPAVGAGKYFRIQDNGYIDSTAGIAGTYQAMAVVRGCDTVTNINTTVGNFPNLLSQGDANPDNTGDYTGISHIKHTTDGSATVVPWVITADDRTANILSYYNKGGTALTAIDHTAYANYIVMGDVAPLNSTDNPNASVLWGNNFSTADSSSNVDGGIGDIQIHKKYLCKGYEGNTGAIEHGYVSTMYTMYNNLVIGAYSPSTGAVDYQAYPNPRIGGLTYSDILVYEDISAIENTDSSAHDLNTIQSKMRGVLACGCPVNLGAGNIGVGDFLDTMTIDGETHILVFANDSTNPFAMLLQTTGNL